MSTAQSSAEAKDGFDRFRLDSTISRGIQAAGFETPRPIQAKTIPACLEGRDVMGLAQTGTGKTAAFALPILQRLIDKPGRGPVALVLAPTRELAQQINTEIRLLAQFTKTNTVTVFGGVSAHSQIQALRRNPHIVVGCPGRVLDLLQQRRLDLSHIKTLVLDEADHMFDMGFLPDIKKILAALPKERQNLLFSATMPKAIRELANRTLNEPHVVELAHSAPAERIEHALYPVAEESVKKKLLDHILAEDERLPLALICLCRLEFRQLLFSHKLFGKTLCVGRQRIEPLVKCTEIVSGHDAAVGERLGELFESDGHHLPLRCEVSIIGTTHWD